MAADDNKRILEQLEQLGHDLDALYARTPPPGSVRERETKRGIKALETRRAALQARLNPGFFERLRGPSSVSYRGELARRRKAAAKEAKERRAIERQAKRDEAKRVRLQIAEANRVKRHQLAEEMHERERERREERKRMSEQEREQERIFKAVQKEERAEKRRRKKEREREGLGPGYEFDLNPRAKTRKRRRNQSAFDRCVADVEARGGARDPRAVCATAGRKKYGQAEMTRRSVAGRKKAARRRGRGNPEEGAARMYEKFHGRPSSKVEVFTDQVHEHSWLAQLGRLVYLIVKVGANKGKFLDFEGKGVRVACTEDGGQIYFVGGNAELALKDFGLSSTLPKDHVELGPCVEICYHTQKGFHNFEPIDYNHKFGFGRPGGFPPVLNYDVMNKRPYLTGGSYQVKAEGIVQ